MKEGRKERVTDSERMGEIFAPGDLRERCKWDE